MQGNLLPNSYKKVLPLDICMFVIYLAQQPAWTLGFCFPLYFLYDRLKILVKKGTDCFFSEAYMLGAKKKLKSREGAENDKKREPSWFLLLSL